MCLLSKRMSVRFALVVRLKPIPPSSEVYRLIWEAIVLQVCAQSGSIVFAWSWRCCFLRRTGMPRFVGMLAETPEATEH